MTNRIFDIAEVSASAKLVYIYLCKCADKDGKCFPSHKYMAQQCSYECKQYKISIRAIERSKKELSAKAKLLYFYFTKCSGEVGACFPSHKTIALKIAMSVSSVRGAVGALIDIGLVEKEGQARERDNGQTSNLYKLVTIIGDAVNCVKDAISKLREKSKAYSKKKHKKSDRMARMPLTIRQNTPIVNNEQEGFTVDNERTIPIRVITIWMKLIQKRKKYWGLILIRGVLIQINIKTVILGHTE